jgi:hypothetical protein
MAIQSSRVETGLPKPVIYNHDFVTKYVNIGQHTPPPGFKNQNVIEGVKRMFFMMPPFHVSCPLDLTPLSWRHSAQVMGNIAIDSFIFIYFLF